MQRFTRRKPRSKWPKKNRERATTLIEQGKIQPAGLREIEFAKQEEGLLVTARMKHLLSWKNISTWIEQKRSVLQ